MLQEKENDLNEKEKEVKLDILLTTHFASRSNAHSLSIRQKKQQLSSIEKKLQHQEELMNAEIQELSKFKESALDTVETSIKENEETFKTLQLKEHLIRVREQEIMARE